jgi:hypothetical protein
VSPGDDALDRGVGTLLKDLEIFVVGAGLGQVEEVWHDRR